MKLPENWLRYVGIALVIGLALVIAIFMIVEVAFGNGMLYTFGVFLVVMSVTFGIFAIRALWFGWRPFGRLRRESEVVPLITSVDLDDDAVWKAAPVFSAEKQTEPEAEKPRPDWLMDGEEIVEQTPRHWIMAVWAVGGVMLSLFFLMTGVSYQGSRQDIDRAIVVLSVVLSIALALWPLWQKFQQLRALFRKEEGGSSTADGRGYRVLITLVSLGAAAILLLMFGPNLAWLWEIATSIYNAGKEVVMFVTQSLQSFLLTMFVLTLMKSCLVVWEWKYNPIIATNMRYRLDSGIVRVRGLSMMYDRITDTEDIRWGKFGLLNRLLPWLKMRFESAGQDQALPRWINFFPKSMLRHAQVR